MKMKNLSTAILSTAMATTLVVGVAFVAQAEGTGKVQVDGKIKPAITNPDVVPQNPTAPVPGRNSFTEVQAKERIAAAGYTNISPLAMGDDGLWRGSATKGTATVDVSLDYQGNVTTGK